MNIMKVMRNSKVLYLLLWGVIVAFVAWIFSIGGSGIATSMKEGKKDYLVKVEERTVPPRALNLAMQFQRDQIRSYLGEQYVDQFMKDAPQTITSGFVDSLILESVADEMGLAVTDAEIAETIQKMYKFTEPQTQYPLMLQARGVSALEFEALIRMDLARSKMLNLFSQRYILSDGEAEPMYREENSKYKAKVISVRAGNFAKDFGPVPESEVRAVYEREKADLRVPERRTVKYLMISAPMIRASLEIPEPELRNYYESNKERFGDKPFDQVKAQVKNLMLFSDKTYETKVKELFDKATEEFKAAKGEAEITSFAQKFNLKVNTTKPMSLEKPEPPFMMEEKAKEGVFSAKKGEWSELYEMPMSSMRYCVTEVTEPRPATLDDVREAIINDLTTEGTMELARKAAFELKAGFKDAQALDDEAKKRQFQVQDSGDISVKDPVPLVGKDPEFAKLIYAAEPNTIAGPYKTKDGYAIAFLMDKKPADMSKFKAEKADFVDKKAKEGAREYMSSLLARKRKQLEAEGKIDINQDVLKQYGPQRES